MKRVLFLGPYTHHLSSKNVVACYRIVRWLCSNIPGCELIQYEDYNKQDCYKNVDAIIYFYSAFHTNFDEIILFMQKHPNAKLYWLYNEHSLSLNSSILKFLKERSYEVITNLVDSHSKSIKDTSKKIHILNMNVTAFRDGIQKISFDDRPIRLIYYGSYKPERQIYLNEYFQNAVVSASSWNVNKFKINGLNAKFIDNLVWGSRDSTLNRCKYSVYVEDKALHDNKYNHLSDRFYECVSNGVILFFDKNCKKNISKSGYHIDDYFIISSKDELNEKMNEIDKNPSIRKRYFDNVINNIECEKNDLRENFIKII